MEMLTGLYAGSYGLASGAIVIFLWIFFLYLIANDAEKCGKTRWAWGLIYIMNPPIGIAIYLFLKFTRREVVLSKSTKREVVL